MSTTTPGSADEAPDKEDLQKRPPRWLKRGVIFVLVAVAGLQVAEWLFYRLGSFLGLLFLAWLFAISVEPVVDRLARRGWRRGVATGVVLFGLALFLVSFVAVFGALLVDQLAQLVSELPTLVREVVAWANGTFRTDFRPGDIVDSLNLTPEKVQTLARELTPGVLGIISSLVGLVFQGFTLLLFIFYMSAEGPTLRRNVSSWFPPRQQRIVSTVWEIAVEKAGGYVVSRLVLALVSAVLTGLFLWLLGVPFWLPLAIWTGVVSQFIPTIGTYLAIAVPALIALAGQPMDAVWVVVFGIVYQQVENYLFAPRVTARTVSIHPAVAFGSVVAGAALFGPIGALVSIPVIAAVQAVIETYGRRYELIEAPPEPPEPPSAGAAERPPEQRAPSADERAAAEEAL
ncbi:MAG TPA: AI-2E family transporter [Nocardioidaceae bacterium]